MSTAEDDKNQQRYFAALHAVQSAVAFEIEAVGDNAAAADHKHLRTGINSCLVDSSAVAGLLIQKGIFTESEYLLALADAAEREQATLTEKMQKLTGNPRLNFG